MPITVMSSAATKKNPMAHTVIKAAPARGSLFTPVSYTHLRLDDVGEWDGRFHGIEGHFVVGDDAVSYTHLAALPDNVWRPLRLWSLSSSPLLPVAQTAGTPFHIL